MGYVRLRHAAAEIEQVPRRRRVSENSTLNQGPDPIEAAGAGGEALNQMACSLHNT